MYGQAGGSMQPGGVCLGVYRQAGANTVAVSDAIMKTLVDLRKEIPTSVNLDVFYDKSVTIIDSVRDVKNTIFIALFLVIMVIFLFCLF